MNAPSESPTTQDPSLRALIERGLAQAQAREAAAGPIEEPSLAVGPPAETWPRRHGPSASRPTGPAWSPTSPARASGAPAPGGGRGGELVRLLDATDQLGMVQRIDAGPPLGALAFDVIVWACTRWRELGEVDERRVPFTLEAMAGDLGWRKGGGAATELARALDTLRLATFRARVYNARLGRPALTPSAFSTAGSAASPTGPGARRERAFSSSATGFTSSCSQARHLRQLVGAAGASKRHRPPAPGLPRGRALRRPTLATGDRRATAHDSRDHRGQALPPARDPAPRGRGDQRARPTATSACASSRASDGRPTCSSPGGPRALASAATRADGAMDRGRTCDETAPWLRGGLPPTCPWPKPLIVRFSGRRARCDTPGRSLR